MAVDEEEDEEEERSSLRTDQESPILSQTEQSPFREEESMPNPYQSFTQTDIQQQVRVRLCVRHATDHLFIESSSFRAELCKIQES